MTNSVQSCPSGLGAQLKAGLAAAATFQQLPPHLKLIEVSRQAQLSKAAEAITPVTKAPARKASFDYLYQLPSVRDCLFIHKL